MKTINGLINNLTDNAKNQLDSKLTQALGANKTIAGLLNTSKINANNAYFGMSAMEAKAAYRKLYSHGSILQCNYAVYLNDIFNIQRNLNSAPWFHQDFPLSWLATDVEMSLGSAESESFYVGSHQCNYLTQQSSDTLEVTFIETKNMDISKSFDYCNNVTFGKTGSVSEPKHYTFELITAIFGNRRDLHNPVFEKRYLVAVKEGSITWSSSGRNEIAKVQVTFQKIRSHELFKNSVAWK